MKIEQYKQVLNELGELIQGSEFEGHVFSVGGCERDRLLGHDIKDIDLVVDIENGGIKLANWLYENGYLVYEPVTYENYGTAMFQIKTFPDIELEAVQTRKESYRDMTTRNPETAFGTIQEDCKRRDFTINALYRTVGTDELHDFTGRSLDDLNKQIIVSCDDPDIIFKEDPLRIIRAVRFKSKLGWHIDRETYIGMINNVERLNIISQERLTDEFNKITLSKNFIGGIYELRTIGALKYVCRQLDAVSDEDFHWAMDSLRLTDSILEERVAVMLMKTTLPDVAMREMKYSNDFIDNVVTIIKNVPIVHGLGEKYNSINIVDVRKLQYIVKTPKMFGEIVVVAHAINNRDCAVVRKNMQAMHVHAVNIKLMRDGTSCYGYKLPVNGEDVMEIKGIGPGKEIKQCLRYLMEEAFKNPRITREECVKLIKKYDIHGK